jgi:hypothetical protein
MFGCLAVYVEDKIVLVLRGRRDNTADNGVWLATTAEPHESLHRELFKVGTQVRVLSLSPCCCCWLGHCGSLVESRRGWEGEGHDLTKVDPIKAFRYE